MVQQRQQMKQAISSFYLTLISIIASLAFGYLLSVLETDKLFGDKWSFIYWLQVIASFQAIILTWHEYAISSVIFKWVLNYLDSLIPFLFGITLFAIIRSLKASELQCWLYSLAAFTFVGTIAYSNQAVKMRKEHENLDVLRRLRNYHTIAILTSLLCTFLFCLWAYISMKYVSSKFFLIFIGVATNAIFVGYVIWGHFCWRNALNNNLNADTKPTPTSG